MISGSVISAVAGAHGAPRHCGRSRGRRNSRQTSTDRRSRRVGSRSEWGRWPRDTPPLEPSHWPGSTCEYQPGLDETSTRTNLTRSLLRHGTARRALIGYEHALALPGSERRPALRARRGAGGVPNPPVRLAPSSGSVGRTVVGGSTPVGGTSRLADVACCGAARLPAVRRSSTGGRSMGERAHLGAGEVAETSGKPLRLRERTRRGHIPSARRQGPPRAGAGASRGADHAVRHRGRRRALQPFQQLRSREQAGT